MRCLLLLLPALVWAQTLEEKLDSLVAQSPAMQRAAWGVHAVDLLTGRVLLARNQDNYFVPASNTKLLSTAMALSRLGPDYRLVTRLMTGAAPDANGNLFGDLILVGGGDPSLSAREVPYRKGPINGDSLAALDGLAEQAWQAGLRTVSGKIVGDDAAYLWEPYPDGWSKDDTLWEYGAPVSALILHDNAAQLHAAPGLAPGDPARVWVTPSLGFFTFDSHVRTINRGSAAQLRFEPVEGTGQLRVWGAVPLQRETSRWIAVPDPARYAAYAMREALIRRGIAVQGAIEARHRYPGQPPPPAPLEHVLVKRESPPLVELLKVVNKVSQNLHAEIALLETARALGKPPGRAVALDQLKLFLAEAGVRPGDFHLEDGSGLSRLTLFTPAGFTTLLRHMMGGPHAEAWVDLMPVGGEDGTLDLRFKGFSQGRVRAKTGTISHVSALSGYLDTKDERRIVFSILVNNANMPASVIRQFIDKIVGILAE
ncbi:MAG: D-alanyl-D-alanine carboxypeptidase/D-alanyl-D-alanine-endopeptidase [Acidobacteriia bacterium]|nr:D-alanyl-D-alanine carboxypeptidase/D-alanyl-D-alanine-endopeptidase [Terriglobia bacterium]